LKTSNLCISTPNARIAVEMAASIATGPVYTLKRHQYDGEACG
jgi:hypothetical protein